jgi:hypothetical protein
VTGCQETRTQRGSCHRSWASDREPEARLHAGGQ